MSDRFPVDPGAPRISLQEAVRRAQHAEGRVERERAAAETTVDDLRSSLAESRRQVAWYHRELHAVRDRAEAAEKERDEMLAGLRWMGVTRSDEDDHRPWVSVTDPQGECEERSLEEAIGTILQAAANDYKRKLVALVAAVKAARHSTASLMDWVHLDAAMHAAQEPAVTPPPAGERLSAVEFEAAGHAPAGEVAP